MADFDPIDTDEDEAQEVMDDDYDDEEIDEGVVSSDDDESVHVNDVESYFDDEVVLEPTAQKAKAKAKASKAKASKPKRAEPEPEKKKKKKKEKEKEKEKEKKGAEPKKTESKKKKAAPPKDSVAQSGVVKKSRARGKTAPKTAIKKISQAEGKRAIELLRYLGKRKTDNIAAGTHAYYSEFNGLLPASNRNTARDQIRSAIGFAVHYVDLAELKKHIPDPVPDIPGSFLWAREDMGVLKEKGPKFLDGFRVLFDIFPEMLEIERKEAEPEIDMEDI